MSPEATDGYDRLLDAHWLETDPSLVLVSKIDTEDYLIQAISTLGVGEQKRIPLRVKTKIDGKHVFGVDSLENFGGEYKLYLEDKELGKTEELGLAKGYEVDLSQGEYEGRFYLVFGREMEEGGGKGTGSGGLDTGDVATGVEESLKEGTLKVYQDKDFIYVERTDSKEIKRVEIYDVAGRLISGYGTSRVDNRQLISKYNLEGGVYIIRVTMSDDEVKSTRIPVIR